MKMLFSSAHPSLIPDSPLLTVWLHQDSLAPPLNPALPYQQQLIPAPHSLQGGCYWTQTPMTWWLSTQMAMSRSPWSAFPQVGLGCW